MSDKNVEIGIRVEGDAAADFDRAATGVNQVIEELAEQLADPDVPEPKPVFVQPVSRGMGAALAMLPLLVMGGRVPRGPAPVVEPRRRPGGMSLKDIFEVMRSSKLGQAAEAGDPRALLRIGQRMAKLRARAVRRFTPGEHDDVQGRRYTQHVNRRGEPAGYRRDFPRVRMSKRARLRARRAERLASGDEVLLPSGRFEQFRCLPAELQEALRAGAPGQLVQRTWQPPALG